MSLQECFQLTPVLQLEKALEMVKVKNKSKHKWMKGRQKTSMKFE